MDSQFELHILGLKWLDRMEETNDLCVHGKVYLKIGNETLCDADKGEWTLSPTALYLMRTLEEDYEPGQYASQLIPCCGTL